MNLKKTVALILCLPLLASYVSLANSDKEASRQEIAEMAAKKRQYVSDKMDEMFKVYKNTRGKKINKLEALVDLFGAAVAWDEAARLSIGSNWRRLTPKQQQEYLRLFKPFFNAAAVYQFASFAKGSREAIKVLRKVNHLPGTNDDDVDCIISTPDRMQYALTFRIRTQPDKSFMVINIVGEGIDMQEVYKARFASIYEENGGGEAGGEAILANMRNQIEGGKKARLKYK